MFVFGINLPVAEILFVALVLVFVALAVIIVELVRMGKHIRVLDETTLEIRRYEREEEVTLKPLQLDTRAIDANARKLILQASADLGKLERTCAQLLLAGESPSVVRERLLRRGVADWLATRAVNSAIWRIGRFAPMERRAAHEHAGAVAKAARARY